jgi:hypothetical protein
MVYTDTAGSHDDTDIMLRYSNDNGQTWLNPPIRINDDTTTRSQFFPRIAIDPVSGNIAVCWLDARNDPMNKAVQTFCSMAPPADPPSFLPNNQISGGSSTTTSLRDRDDYSGLAFLGNVAHPVWADNSNSTRNRNGTPDNPDGKLEAYTNRVMVRDCVSFNPTTTTVTQIGGTWKVVDGNAWLFDFNTDAPAADSTLAIIKHYNMNQSCFIGRPAPSFTYMLVSESAPSGPLAGEDCIAFNPASVAVASIGGRWKVVDGSHWLFDFSTNKSEADQALEVIRTYGFSQTCFVARPNPSFSYLRK